jgi:hypothetical protein
VAEVKGTDTTAGKPWQITARVFNASASAIEAQVRCALVDDRIYPPPQQVTVPAQGEVSVTFRAAEGAAPLPLGLHTFRVYVPGHFGVTATGDFSVK